MGDDPCQPDACWRNAAGHRNYASYALPDALTAPILLRSKTPLAVSILPSLFASSFSMFSMRSVVNNPVSVVLCVSVSLR